MAATAEFRRKRIPVLTLSPQAVSQLDPYEPDVLYSLWSAFTRCTDSIENGRRLENMSWRLWNRDVLNSTKNHNKTSCGDLAVASTDQSKKIFAKIQQKHNLTPTLPTADYFDQTIGDSPRSTSGTPTIGPPRHNASTRSSSNSSSSRTRNDHSGSSTSISRQHNYPNHHRSSPRTVLRRNSSSFTKKGRNPNPNLNLNPNSASLSSPKQSEITSNRDQTLVKDEKLGEPKTTGKSAAVATESTFGRRLSNQQIQHIFSLFRPEKDEEDYWKHLWEEKRKNNKSKEPSLTLPSAQTSVTSPRPNAARTISSPSAGNLARQSSTMTGSTNMAVTSKRPSLFARKSTTAIIDFSDSSDDETEEDSDISDRARAPRRNNTFTSIVRGFSPSHISVSVINRSPNMRPVSMESDGSDAVKQSVSPSSGGQSPQQFQATKARPDKMTRENMFFIESSPSDNEGFGGESMSSNEDRAEQKGESPGSASKPAAAAAAAIKPKPPTCPPSSSISREAKPKKAAPVSLFSKSRSTSAISSKIKEKYQATRNESTFFEKSSEEDEWDSVDDSDYSFDEQTLAARDIASKEKESSKKPLVRSSLLSSLFLNNPELLQKQQEEQRQKMYQQKKKRERVERLSQNSDSNVTVGKTESNESQPPERSLYRVLSNHAEEHHGSLPTDILKAGTNVSDSSSAAATSPRTTRRNMLATELSESVRKNLLWERQRASTLNYVSPVTQLAETTTDSTRGSGALKRSHTSIGVPYIKGQSMDYSGGESWKEQMDDTNVDFNYHARGW